MKIPKSFRPEKELKENIKPNKLESFLKDEYKKIDEHAKQEKQAVDYIARVTNKYWDELVEICDPYKKLKGYELEEKLFNKTKKIIDNVEAHLAPAGITMRIRNPQKFMQEPEIVLGWVGLTEDRHCHVYYVTDEGLRIVNDLKKIKNQPNRRRSKKSIKVKKKKAKFRGPDPYPF